MRFSTGVGLVFILIGTHGAVAACRDDIGKIQMQTRSKEQAAMSKSSGGQATAAQQEAEHGTGGAAQQADVALNDAKVASGKGDEAGCQAALAKARQKLGQ